MAELKRNLQFEDVRIGFKNFDGKEGKYNRKGERNFVIFLDTPELLDFATEQKLNVKVPKPLEVVTDDGDTRSPYVQVEVAYSNFPPRVVLINGDGGGSEFLDENTVSILDWTRLIRCDIILNIYDWEVNGNSGRKAYLKTMYATKEEDPFAERYGL